MLFRLLTDRWKDGYWYYEPEPPAEPNHKEYEASSLKPALLREKYLKACVQYEDDKAAYDRISVAVTTKNSKEALRILFERCDYEYESISVEPLEE